MEKQHQNDQVTTPNIDSPHGQKSHPNTTGAINSNGTGRQDHPDEDIAKRLETISKKDANELTVFDLVFLFGSRFKVCRIHGELYSFNGKHFYPITRQDLESKILEVLFDKLEEMGDIRVIRSIAYIIERVPLIDYEESSDWLGFANGVVNIRTWQFWEYSVLKPRLVPSSAPLPQQAGYPQTPPEPPIITYNLQAPFDFYSLSTGQFQPTPVADKFFYDITGGDKTLITRIYEMIGYLIVPDTAAKVFFLLQGVPNSGKSILGRFLEGFFPLNCVTALDISRLGGQFLPKDLETSRLNLSMDLPDGLLSKKAIATIKMLTGNDLITHEAKYKDAKPFRGQCKFLFSINGKLKMTGRDLAFLDRIICIPFRYSVPQNQRDEFLLSKLDQEREGIMMKALAYYRNFVARNRQFTGEHGYQPDIEYRLSANDTIREFVDSECVLQDGARTHTETLFNAYITFCRKNGIHAVDSCSGFSQRLSNLYSTKIIGNKRWRDANNEHKHGYFQIALINNSSSYIESLKSTMEQQPYEESEDDYWEDEDSYPEDN